MSVTHGPNQSCQQMAVIEMQLHQQRPCQSGLKERQDADWKEGRLSAFLDITGWDHKSIQMQIYVSLPKKERLSTKAVQRSSLLPPHCQNVLHCLGFTSTNVLSPKALGENLP